MKEHTDNPYKNTKHVKVSIITATYNSAQTLGDAMKSVLDQTYSDIEYIIVDGASSDGTQDVVRQYESQFAGRLKWMSEKDRGIYDAMNKGIRMATGDVIGILNSDDYFTSNDVVQRIVSTFDNKTDAIYGDIHFIHDGQPDKCVRYYSSKHFRPLWLRFGFMPAHPSFYCRREVFDKAGLYKIDYAIGSDFEMMVRLFMKHRINARYLNMDFVTMRTGGASTRNVKSRMQLIKEDVRGCRENGIYTNALMISMKFLYKIFEFKF
jgi:glycosyltransferase involved in cell wall biosynthesis